MSNKEYQDLQERELTKLADQTLDYVGLSIDALKSISETGSIVDLGCGRGQVGRAAAREGIDSIVSIYYGFEQPDPTTPRLLKMDALKGIELPDSSVELLFSRNGPHLWNRTREEAITLFKSINRILGAQAEARFYVPWLGCIQKEIYEKLKGTKDNKYQNIWTQLAKPADWKGGSCWRIASKVRLERVKPYLIQAMDESIQFLQQSGFNVQLVENPEHPEKLESKFWIMKKRE